MALAFFLLICGRQTFALDPHREIKQYGHEVWQTESGLPQNTIHSVLQTRDGHIWLATDGGLVRFDGNQFLVFDKKNTPQFKSNYIRSLFEGHNGDLWISTADGLMRWKDSRFNSFTAADGLLSNNVWSVYEDRAGNLWINTTGGLNQYRDGKFTGYTAQNGLAGNNIGQVVEDKDGALWIGTEDGLSRFVAGKFTTFTTRDGLSSNSIKAICPTSDGALWIATPSGLNMLKDGRFTVYTTHDGLPANWIETLYQDHDGRLWVGTTSGLGLLDGNGRRSFTTKDGLPGDRIEAIYQDREGSIWVATPNGLGRYADGRFTGYTTKEGLSSNIVLAVYEDRESNLWLGTESGGLNLLRDEKFITYTTSDGLSDNLVSSIFEDTNSTVWVGANGGGLNQFRNGKWTAYSTREGLASNTVLAIQGDREGNLWIGTPDGLNRFKNGKFNLYTASDGLSDDFVRSIYEDREGRLWIGTRRGLTLFKNGAFTPYSVLDGLANDLVGAIVEGRDGSIWIGTLGGLSRFKDNVFTNYTAKEGLSSDVVTSLYEDSDGSLWIGTNGGGLDRFKDGKFSSFTTKEGLFDDVVYGILEDGQDNLWMSCPNGIFRVSRKDLNDAATSQNKSIHTVSYGTTDGMKIRECSGAGHPANWKTRDGRLWFSTVKGIALIDPQRITLNQLAPPVTIEQVTVDDEPIAGGTVSLEPGNSRFAFYYAGLSFVAPQKVRFKYMLEGFDHDWIDAGASRVAFYTNIPPGNHRFKVKACNNDGIWNESGTAFYFFLRPHYYQTKWFYSVCIIIVGLLVWQIYRLHLKRVESEFRAVLGERNRIAREIHDTLAQGFTSISVQLELVSKLLTVSTEAAREHIDQARILVRTSLAEARRSIWDLRSQILEESDLPTSLSNSAKQLTSNTPTQFQMQVSGSFRHLPALIEGNLLRIGQEAITNAVRHAGARHIVVDLKFDSKRLQLSVRDDGRGFDSQTPPTNGGGHFGLVGMRERAKEIGGKLTVQSSKETGTEIMVEAIIG